MTLPNCVVRSKDVKAAEIFYLLCYLSCFKDVRHIIGPVRLLYDRLYITLSMLESEQEVKTCC